MQIYLEKIKICQEPDECLIDILFEKSNNLFMNDDVLAILIDDHLLL